MDKMILILKLSLAAGAVMAVILLVYEILLSIDFVKGCWRRHIKRTAQKGQYPEPGNFRKYIYGRRSGRCIGSRKPKKRIVRNAKKGKR